MARTPEQQAEIEEASRGLLEELDKPDPAAERPNIDFLVRAYAAARDKREVAGAEEKRLRKIEEEAERELFDELEKLGLRSVKHQLGHFILNDQAWASVVDPVAIRNWAEQNAPDLITVNLTRINPYVREALKEGTELPPGVDYSIKRRIQWRGRE